MTDSPALDLPVPGPTLADRFAVVALHRGVEIGEDTAANRKRAYHLVREENRKAGMRVARTLRHGGSVHVQRIADA